MKDTILTNPEADEISSEDLQAAANLYDNIVRQQVVDKLKEQLKTDKKVKTVKVSMEVYFDFDVTNFPEWATNPTALEALIEAGLADYGRVASFQPFEEILGRVAEIEVESIDVWR